MTDDVFFRMPFATVEEMEKTFRDNGISDADVLSFRDGMESTLQEYVGTTQVSKITYDPMHLKQLCNWLSISS